MKLFLDCEFTQLTAAAKLISLALVAEDGREFYVELTDTWRKEDCSKFVVDIVLPQLWGSHHVIPEAAARAALLAFLATLEEVLKIVTDAPQFDWSFSVSSPMNEVDRLATFKTTPPPRQRSRLKRRCPTFLPCFAQCPDYRRHVSRLNLYATVSPPPSLVSRPPQT